MRVNLLKRLESSIHSFCLTLEKILNNINEIEYKINNHREFANDIDVLDFDFYDQAYSDMFIGGKVKVLIYDMDLHKCKECLISDRKSIDKVLIKSKVITKDRE